MRKLLSVVLLFTIFIAGCVGGTKRQIREEPLDKAIEYYHSKKYQKVLDILKERVSSYIYTPRGDEAEYYLAMSYFNLKDYEDAILEFEFLINNYSQSKYRKKAYYNLALSYYLNSPRIERDQSDLKKALHVITEFESEYPDSHLYPEMEALKKKILNKLSLKMADVIKTYYNLEKYTSALLYINLLRKEYPETQGENLTYVFEALIKKDEGADYTEILSKINPEAIPSKFKKYYKKLISPK